MKDAHIFVGDKFFGIAEHCTTQEYIFLYREVSVKAGAQLKQCGNLSVYRYAALCRLHNTRYHLEQCRFACSVSADNSEQVAFVERKRNIINSGKVLGFYFMLYLLYDVFLKTDISEIAYAVIYGNVFNIYNH